MASGRVVFPASFKNDISTDLWSGTVRTLLDTKRISGTEVVKTETHEHMDNADRDKLTHLVWVDCPYPLLRIGLSSTLVGSARVHAGSEAPSTDPDAVIFGTGGVEGLLEGMKRHRKLHPQAVVLVMGLYLDLSAARSALRAGARGYIHAGMMPDQITRAVEIAMRGEIVAPRALLEYLISDPEIPNINILSPRQREIIDLVAEGMSNAQIASRLFLSESTIKQHLRAAYKALGVRNRYEAARLLQNGSQSSLLEDPAT